MKKDKKIILYSFIGALLLGIIVLFIIHICFKVSAPCDFFIPLWDASNVLEYFGVILGITVTFVSLIYSNYSSRKEQQEIQKFQINQELKNKINEICINILREFSFPKINVAVTNLLAKKNSLNKFIIQEEFNKAFFELEILWSGLRYYKPKNACAIKEVGSLISGRLDAISKLEQVFLDGCLKTRIGQKLSDVDEDKVQEYLQESFSYILENTEKLTEQLKLINDSVGESNE